MMNLLSPIVCVGLLLSKVASLPLKRDIFDRSDNIAVYWGQNSYGQATGPLSQHRLVDYCANSNIDIIPLAFLVSFTTTEGKDLELNFANQLNDCSLFSGTQLAKCPTIEQDIKTCQQVYGKKILLSLGGATFQGLGFSSPAQASAAARLLMNTFGPITTSQPSAQKNTTTSPAPTHVPYNITHHPALANQGNWTWSTKGQEIKPRDSQTTVLRPFGDAVIDGFDLDFESPVQFSVPFARTLRSLMDNNKTKRLYLTTAPECPISGNAIEKLLNSEVSFDAVFVQFYNNYCGLQSFTPGASTQLDFNFNAWNEYAAPRGTKVFLGVPAGPTAAGSGYQTVAELEKIIRYSQHFPTFGGVMMWDMSQSYANKGFIAGVKRILNSAARLRRL